MIRVISSPSSSTTGLATLILPMLSAFFLGESELQRALGKAARLINRPSCVRSEEHTSELQSLMRISYAVFCLKTKIYTTVTNAHIFTPHTIDRTKHSNTR